MLSSKNSGNNEIERLATAILESLEETASDATTPADAFSAVLTVLNRLLITLRTLEAKSDRIHNIQEIGRALSDLIDQHGTVIH